LIYAGSAGFERSWLGLSTVLEEMRRPNFVLVDWALLSQTSSTMKTLSGKFKVLALVAIGVVAVLAFRAFGQTQARKPHPPPPSQATFVLTIQTDAVVKDEENFEDLLATLSSQLYCVHMKHKQGHPQGHGPHKGQMEYDMTGNANACAQLDIKTDKVTTSERAKSGSSEEFTPIQAHATIQIPSMFGSDIKKVLDALQ
jgi:hypothetical protein